MVPNHMTLQISEIMAFFFPRKSDGPGVNSVDVLTLTQNRSNICRPCHRMS